MATRETKKGLDAVQIQKILKTVRKNLEEKDPHRIKVVTDFSLRNSRKLKQKISEMNSSETWTIFVNAAGTMAHAYHPKFKVFLVLENPGHLRKGVVTELAVNYFYNTMREISAEIKEMRGEG